VGTILQPGNGEVEYEIVGGTGAITLDSCFKSAVDSKNIIALKIRVIIYQLTSRSLLN
jgi:hypothetical protein